MTDKKQGFIDRNHVKSFSRQLGLDYDRQMVLKKLWEAVNAAERSGNQELSDDIREVWEKHKQEKQGKEGLNQ